MRKIACLILCILVLGAGISGGTAERLIPDILRAKQDIVIRKLDHHRTVTYSILHTVREDVNEAVTARVRELTGMAESLVPAGKKENRPARADICTQMTRTGDRWMSFHICAQVSANDRQLWVRSEDYTYDMESGRLILLGDIIRPEGWEPLLQEIRTQLSGFFPGEEPDENALNGICRREALMNAGFVITPGHLALYFPASDVYPAHAEALLRVEVYVPGLWEIITEEARREMDCTGYRLVALTYDDGPEKGTTRDVLNALVCCPGQVTFFMIGTRLDKNAELVHRAFDAGHSVQSHTWDHRIEGVRPGRVAEWERKFNRRMCSIIGISPVMMRPPGGRSVLYANAGCETPMIRWSRNSLDAANGDDWEKMHICFDNIGGAEDGDIILCHDVKRYAGELAEQCMIRFEEKNILAVTVNDLCALRGIPLEPGTVVSGCPPAGEE